MNRPRPAPESGTAAVEAGVAVTGLLLVGFFTIGALRVTGSSGDVHAAARSAARAAAASYDPEQARRAAERVAAGSLTGRGVACRTLTVDVTGDLTAGSLVTVDVTCTVGLDDVTPAGFASTRTVTGRAVERVDAIRGGST